MTTRDEPLDPREVLEAAEAAHLAARHTVSISPEALDRADRGADPADDVPAGDGPAGEGPAGEGPAGAGADRARPDASHETVRLDPERRATVRLDRPTVRLPQQRPPADSRSRAPLPLAAAVAAAWAAALTFLPVGAAVTLLLVAEPGQLAVGGPVRVAAAGWLLAHGVPVETPAGPIGLIPLAISVLAAWRMVRAGVHVARARGIRGTGSVRQALAIAVAVGLGYALIGLVMAVVAGGPGWGPHLPRATVTLAGFGFAAAAYGALRATGALTPWWLRVPPVVRDGARAGVMAAAAVVAAGAAIAGTALALGGGPAAELLAAYGTGVAGQAGLTLLCLAYAPNLAVWSAAYLIGPGFAVGTDTVVRSSEVVIGPLPALPVFAGLPGGPHPVLGTVLLVVPVLIGGVVGWLLARPPWRPAPVAAPPAGGRWWERSPWVRLTLAGLVCGAVAGLLLGALAAAAGGPLGGGQLAGMGPEPVPVGLAGAATIVVGALLGAAAAAGPTRLRR